MSSAPLLPPASLEGAELQGGSNLSSDSSLNATDWSFRRRLKTTKENDDAPTQYRGKGEDDTVRSPKRKAQHRKSASSSVQQTNGHSSKAKKGQQTFTTTASDDLVEEDLKAGNGQHLTSLRRVETELVSGRRAGAGWEKSQ